MTSRESLIGRAKVSEHAQRYEDMVAVMKRVVEAGGELNNDERNLLSSAYKHMAGMRRQSWRVVSSVEQKAEVQREQRLHIVKQYREKIEGELETICMEIINLLDSYLLKSASDTDSQVFYNKMKGDYYRYLCEVSSVPEKRRKLVTNGNKAYNTALGLADEMLPVHPMRLGLALNYSVFLYEIKNSERKACNLAKTAFDDAIAQVDRLKEDSYKDSTLIMQLLRDNITLWGSAMQAKIEHSDDEEDSVETPEK